MARRATRNRDTPWIADGMLHIPDLAPDGTTDTPLLLDSDAWFAWLAESTRFYFEHPAGNFACRKEARQRGGLYWTATRRQAGRIIRMHVGRDDAVTAARLNDVALRLAQQFDDTTTPEVSPTADDQALEPTPALDPFAAIRQRRAGVAAGPLEVVGNTVHRRAAPHDATCVATFHGATAAADAVFFAHAAADIDTLLDAIAQREASQG